MQADHQSQAGLGSVEVPGPQRDFDHPLRLHVESGHLAQGLDPNGGDTLQLGNRGDKLLGGDPRG